MEDLTGDQQLIVDTLRALTGVVDKALFREIVIEYYRFRSRVPWTQTSDLNDIMSWNSRKFVVPSGFLYGEMLAIRDEEAKLRKDRQKSAVAVGRGLPGVKLKAASPLELARGPKSYQFPSAYLRNPDAAALVLDIGDVAGMKVLERLRGRNAVIGSGGG